MSTPESVGPNQIPDQNYDFLFRDEPAPVTEALALPELDDRQKEIFAPVGYGEETERLFDYDYLFAAKQPQSSIESAAVRVENDRRPTEASMRAASEEIVDPTLDSRVRSVLENFTQGASDPGEVARAVHTDANLRAELARLFLAKIEANVEKMPHRVAANKQKNPNHLGYPKYITSREYAALMAISMLDGSFKQETVARGDDISYSRERQGEVVMGQHRAAANLLLHEL